MTAEPESMRLVNPDPAQPPLDDAARAAIKALAAQQHAAGTVLMQVINFVGGQVEDGLKLLPGAQLARIESAASAALRQSYDLAGQSRRGAMAGLAASESGHRALAMISGALGGMGGLPTALAELPVATTVIFRSVQSVAEAHGEDPKSEETRLQCLQVFGAGGPGTGDHLRAKEIDDGATPYNPEQWSCPVTPWMSEIDPDIYVDYEGKRVYFASQKAKEKFQNADEEQKQGFLAIVEQQGHTPGKKKGGSGKTK